MAGNGGLRASPLDPDLGFNWVFLVELLVCGVITVFFLFYFNRIFATLVSYGLRTWTWHKYRVYIDVQAVQISLLAGRVFFKGLRYHGDNQTVLIHSGYVTWTYWLRNVREVNFRVVKDQRRCDLHPKNAAASVKNLDINDFEKAAARENLHLPCRITLNLNGVEWFLYNNSVAYDEVLTRMAAGSHAHPECSGQGVRDTYTQAHTSTQHENHAPVQDHTKSETSGSSDESGTLGNNNNNLAASSNSKQPSRASDVETESRKQVQALEGPANFMLRFLPVHIDCTKAAVVIGNENTKTVLIVTADVATGECDATSPASSLDQYRQLFNFHLDRPVVQMKPNDEYIEDQNTAAQRMKNGGSNVTKQKDHRAPRHSLFHRHQLKAWHSIQSWFPLFSSSVDSIASTLHRRDPTVRGASTQLNWRGLSRYLDEIEHSGQTRWSSIEYAMVTTLLESPRASVSCYWDVAGLMKEAQRFLSVPHPSAMDNINGNIPPEWGADLVIQRGLIQYGPWADRQRADLQSVFFPAICKDTCPRSNLAVGDYRVATQFRLQVKFDEETTLRIPFREDSKNWKWTKEAEYMAAQPVERKRDTKNHKRKTDKGHPGSGSRPFGWLDIKVAEYAGVSYGMDMVASTSGFANKLELDLPNTEITSSVNHGLLWRSVGNRVTIDLSNPLTWNSQRDWRFSVAIDDLELFLLREHVLLLTDLVEDWASGPPLEYLTFTPFKYSLDLHFTEFKLYLNVNDANIVNNPSDFDDNTFISVFGSFLDADILIPVDTYRPPQNNVSFTVEARQGGLQLQVPPWNTQATFLDATEIGRLKRLSIKGRYHYYSAVSPSFTDTLFLNIHGDEPSAQLYGFVIRYFMKVKDNYFGDDIRFKTLEEYQECLRTNGQQTPPQISTNDLDVILAVTADEATAILPSNMYSAKKHTRIDITKLAADLRITNYYMDLDVMLHTLTFSQGCEDDAATTSNSAVSNTQLYVDGFGICGNRLFGLPPSEPTYVCNWDFDVGDVKGECSAAFLAGFVDGVRAFTFSFDDDENALPLAPGVLPHDVIFLRSQIHSLRLWLHIEETAILLSTGSISLDLNDWARPHYSKKMTVLIPNLCVAFVDAESASRHRSRTQHPVETHAVMTTTLSLAMIEKKVDFAQNRDRQQEHIRRHDQPTRRAEFLLDQYRIDRIAEDRVDEPAMPVPSMPLPTFVEHARESQGFQKPSTHSSVRSLKRRSSFLSVPRMIASTEYSIPSKCQNGRGRAMRTPDAGSGNIQPILRRGPSLTDGSSAFCSLAANSRGPIRSGIIFSSPYVAPYFPLLNVEPDLSDLPPLAKSFTLQPRVDLDMLDNPLERDDDLSDHVSFLISFPQSVAVVLNPKALESMIDLISTLQAIDSRDILDNLQFDCVKSIFRISQHQQKRSEIVDVNIRTPQFCLRFVNAYACSPSSADNLRDQYDLSIANPVLTIRKVFKTEMESERPSGHSPAVHLTFAAIGLTAKHSSGDTVEPQTAIKIQILELVFWTVQSEYTVANIVLEKLETEAASGKLDYLVSLFHRSEAIVKHLGDAYRALRHRQRIRVQHLIYSIATAGDGATDPLFLTRPSYVLRSASKHLRNHESWRVMTKLRHLYETLPAITQNQIQSRSMTEDAINVKEAHQRILLAFEQWRSWDWENLSSCIVWSLVFGAGEVATSTAGGMLAMKVAARSGLIRVAVDPGPEQNELVWINVSAAVEIKDATTSSGGDGAAVASLMRTTTVQLYSIKSTISLNWALCGLIENIAKIYQQTPARSAPLSRLQNNIKRPSRYIGHDVHLVINAGKCLLAIDTINIRTVFISKALVASVILKQIKSDKLKANIMIAADAIILDTKSHAQELVLCQCRQPSLYISLDAHGLEGVFDHHCRIAAKCRELTFAIQRDMPVVVEIADLIIGDEITQLHGLSRTVSELGLLQPSRSSSPSTALSASNIDIALFLDGYQVTIPLVHCLTYDVSGNIARACMTAEAKSDFVINFDVSEHSHDLRTNAGNAFTTISLLQMPPANGRLSLDTTQEPTILLWASIEPIQLDAAALNGLLTAISRPEISSVGSDLKDDIKHLQRRLAIAFGRKIPPKEGAERLVIYDAHLTVTGLGILASTQREPRARRSTRLDLDFGRMQLMLTNRGRPERPILNFPVVHMSLSRITFELSTVGDGFLENCGTLSFAMSLTASTKSNNSGKEVRSFHLKGNDLIINLLAETASSVVDVMGHLQDKIKTLDLTKEKEYLRRLRKLKPGIPLPEEHHGGARQVTSSSIMFASIYSLELLDNKINWFVDKDNRSLVSMQKREYLMISLRRLELSTRKENSARLTIEDLQLQMVPANDDRSQQSSHLALLPEVIFNVGYVSMPDARRLAFQAAGKSLDLRLTPQFILPAAELVKSIQSAVRQVRTATEAWHQPANSAATERSSRPFFGKKRMESLLIYADFAGAVVYLSDRNGSYADAAGMWSGREQQAGKYGQFTHTGSSGATALRAPGLAWKIEYKDNGSDDPSLNAEVKVDASTNILYPAVVPLILDITSAIREAVRHDEEGPGTTSTKTPAQKLLNSDDDNILIADPSTVLGRTRLNLGVRICKQEFGLSCQPIARVAATARFNDVYLTVNTVRSIEYGHFFAASATFSRLQASVQHVYSRESTGSFEVDSIFLSLMNSKHLSGSNGISAILKISPMKVLMNIKQLQDFLLFREVWVPPEMRRNNSTQTPLSTTSPPQVYLVQRYQQVAATGAFPWNATVSIAKMDIQLDLGQAIAKSAFIISEFWVSSKKTSEWEQNLCLGFKKVGFESTGRMSGFVTLEELKLRTSIQWPDRERALNQTPLVQGSIGFGQLRVKAAFDYQAFLVADITSFEFVMYNIRNGPHARGDRLVAILDGAAVQLFCTTTTASQALALYQALLRLAQEKRSNYETSLREIEKCMQRKSSLQPMVVSVKEAARTEEGRRFNASPISLHSDVIVTLKTINIGAFPSTFSDHQVFKLEALNAQARFAVMMEESHKIHSILGLTLGQLRIGLAGVKDVGGVPRVVSEISVEDVITSATGSRGGTILKVPKVAATMQTWQRPDSVHIDYIFKSSFEGKVEVGWNYSRISYIRGMWATHSKALAYRLGKPLAPSALKITGVPDQEYVNTENGLQQKITAEVNVPQSKYNYTALEPPIIETPQLRDMGEATPPLEWIGLHRDRLPNLTHQIVIVTLLEIASEVEKSYEKILGTS